jgi:Helix-turn-helix.
MNVEWTPIPPVKLKTRGDACDLDCSFAKPADGPAENEKGEVMIKGAQCRAARALVDIPTEKLARLAGVDVAVIQAFELKIARPSADIIRKLAKALEYAGAVFLPETKDGEGVGVRLKFDSSTARRLAVLENEGGIALPDRLAWP